MSLKVAITYKKLKTVVGRCWKGPATVVNFSVSKNPITRKNLFYVLSDFGGENRKHVNTVIKSRDSRVRPRHTKNLELGNVSKKLLYLDLYPAALRRLCL